jgi:hypothetical protein
MFLSDEYLAGLFDGEGCVTFTHTRIKNGVAPYTHVSISNVRPQVLRLVQKQYGGSIRTIHQKNPRARVSYNWLLPRGGEKRFLEAILPHSVIKRNLIWIYLCYLERAYKPRLYTHNRHGWQVTPTEEIEVREAAARLISKINLKGKT